MANTGPLKAKVVVTVVAEIEVEFSDDGYLGTGVTVEEHVKKAREDIQSATFWIKRGGSELSQVGVRTKVQAVTIIPRTDNG